MPFERYEALQRALVRVVRRASIPRFHERVIRRTGIDLDRVEAVVLGRIADADEMRLSDLAAQLGVACSTAGRHAARLGDRGLVVRAVDPDDARAVVVRSTDEGRELVEQLRASYRALLRAALDDWDPAEVETLTVLMARLADALAAMTEDPVVVPS
jgi:DNA-binding MarR family transcriptional regulator